MLFDSLNTVESLTKIIQDSKVLQATSSDNIITVARDFWFYFNILAGPIIALLSIISGIYFVMVTVRQNRLSKFYDNMILIDKELNERVWGFDELSKDRLEDLRYLTMILDSYCGARQTRLRKLTFYKDDLLYNILSISSNQELWKKYIKPKMYISGGFTEAVDKTTEYSFIQNTNDRLRFEKDNPHLGLVKSLIKYYFPNNY